MRHQKTPTKGKSRALPLSDNTQPVLSRSVRKTLQVMRD